MMRMMMNRSGMLAAMILFAASAAVPVAAVRADPGVWYVKASNYGLDGLTGRDEEHAWGTLQQAHDNASAGDTIYVLPGTYDQGSANGCNRDARLVVSKKLNFIATGRADETFIKGEPSTASAGWGSDGMRCVCIKNSSGYGTTFTRFTLCSGSTGASSGAPYLNTGTSNAGGAAINCYGSPSAARSAAYLVDCVVSNNFGKWGSMYGGTAIRCLIKDNCGSGFGGVVCSAALWNSVVVGSKTVTSSRSAVGNACVVVNSTIAAASTFGIDDTEGRSRCYNTLLTSIGSTAMRSGPAYTNCYATSYGVYSPATGDFRPVAGMEADGAGRTEYITNTLALPEGLEMKDFNGNPIDLTKETCDVGAVQGAVEPVTAAFVLPVETTVNGIKTPRYKSTYARETEWPREVVVKPVSENFFSYEFSGKLCGGPARRFLLRDGTLRFLPSPFASDNMTLTERPPLRSTGAVRRPTRRRRPGPKTRLSGRSRTPLSPPPTRLR